MAIFGSKEAAYTEEARLKAEGRKPVMTQTSSGWDVSAMPEEEYSRYVDTARNPTPAMPPPDRTQRGPSLEEALADADDQFDLEPSASDVHEVMDGKNGPEDTVTRLQRKALEERAKAELNEAKRMRRESGTQISPSDVVNAINKATRVKLNRDMLPLYVGTEQGDRMRFYRMDGLRRTVVPGGAAGNDGLSHLRALTNPSMIKAPTYSIGKPAGVRPNINLGLTPQNSPLAREALKTMGGNGKSPLATIATQMGNVAQSRIGRIATDKPMLFSTHRQQEIKLGPRTPANNKKQNNKFYKRKMKNLRSGR